MIVQRRMEVELLQDLTDVCLERFGLITKRSAIAALDRPSAIRASADQADSSLPVDRADQHISEDAPVLGG